MSAVKRTHPNVSYNQRKRKYHKRFWQSVNSDRPKFEKTTTDNYCKSLESVEWGLGTLGQTVTVVGINQFGEKVTEILEVMS